MIGYIHTASGITVLLNGRVHNVTADDPRFNDLSLALADGEEDIDYLESLVASKAVALQAAIDAENVSGTISIGGNQVYYKGQPINNSLTTRMLEHIEKGIDIMPMIPFLENLELNPSRRVEQNLYEFLERGRVPLSKDGHFYAYKAIRSDWKDIHSGTFDNSIGRIVEVPRNQVDEDPDRTCSHGLHVCSWDYLPSFAHADGHVVVVKINPRDVVAIPRDYNLTKMRVCRYEVVGEVDDYYGARRNVLSESPVYSDVQPSWALDGDPELSDTDPYVVDVYESEDARIYGNPKFSKRFVSAASAEEWIDRYLHPGWPVMELVDTDAGVVLLIRRWSPNS